MDFHEWKIVYFVSDFFETCSCGFTFVDNISNWILMNAELYILYQISLKQVPKGLNWL